ncbi:Ig-like domain-containing protein, partial [Pseudomonas sp. F1_0610]|uniref:Ig-like domain-containing protein n=1 Tax=Pseudomonas sp. F1_0610 TaxID=3114284 RepID=UPI0039C2F68E
GDKGITNDTTPTLKGSLSQALGAGEYLAIYRNGSEIARLSEAQLNGSLTWSFEDSGLTDATYTYTARVKDAAGNNGAISNNYEITVDTQAPDQKVQIDSIEDDQAPGIGSIPNGGTTNDTTPELRGSLSKGLNAGEAVFIYRNGVKVGKATVNGTNWSFEDSGLANKTGYSYTARVEDQAGNQGAYSDPYSINIDFTGPSTTVTITTVIDDVDPIQGDISSGGYTNDNLPQVQGTLSAALKAGEVVSIYRDGAKVGEATVTGTQWTFDESIALNDGQHIYTAYVEDAANNLGAASNRYEINVDTVAPDHDIVITDIIDNKDPVVGPIGNGGFTNDDTPTLEGTLSKGLAANEFIAIYRDGVKIGEVTLGAGVTQWSYEDSGLSSGSAYKYSARVEDRAGNHSAYSNEYSINLSTDGASQGTQILSITDDVEPITGIIKNNGYTNDKTPTLKGAIDSALKGTEEVIVYRNGVEVGKATVTGTTWTFEDSLAGDGKYTYTAGVKDAAGNAGALSNE